MGGSASKATSKAPKLRYKTLNGSEGNANISRSSKADKEQVLSPSAAPGATAEAIDGGQSPEELLAQHPDAASAMQLTDDTADPHLAGFLDQLGGSIQGRRVNITATPTERARLKQHAAAVKATNQTGVRLDTMVLRCLFEDAKAAKFQQDGRISVPKLAEEYGVDENLLAAVLRYNATPSITENDEGQLIGSWPSSRP